MSRSDEKNDNISAPPEAFFNISVYLFLKCLISLLPINTKVQNGTKMTQKEADREERVCVIKKTDKEFSTKLRL